MLIRKLIPRLRRVDRPGGLSHFDPSLTGFALRASVPSGTAWLRYQFPRDHFSHPEFKTEWWYYTGNVRTTAGHRYGFELVFFRQGQHRDSTNPSAWRVDDLYLAHLALTDIDSAGFHFYDRVNRAGPGIAGASLEEGQIWNGNWQANWDLANGAQTLTAVENGIRFTLHLTPRTAPIIHGENGISLKSETPGHASHYVSFPLLAVEGSLNGAAVTGTAWMDHEWFSDILEESAQGWDWFSVQLDDHTELMLFEMRNRDNARRAFRFGHLYRCGWALFRAQEP